MAGVVKRGVGPQTGVVTAFASGRECGCDVVHGRLRIVVIRLMARDAGGGGQVVIVVDVTIGTGTRRHGVTAGEREPGAVVIERGVEPGASAVALFAGLREIRGDVIGIGGSLEILQVAAHAGRGVEVVVVVDMAVGAGARRNGVQAGEREPGAVVIERGIEPGAGVVTLVAGLREIRSDVIGIRRSLVVLQVAGRAGRAVQVVVVVDVAVGAGARRNGVQSGKRETGAVVIERGIKPGAGAVALVAGLREVRRDVIGIGGSLVVLQVAGRAGRAVQVVVVVDVAVGAGARRNGVQSGKRETGAVVIERGIKPGAGAVALVAGLREVRRDVIGIRRSLIVLQVAGRAGRAVEVVVVINVAVGAGARRDRVQAGERETGAVVIERGIKPGAGGVALVAGLREVRRDVIGIRRSLIVLQVAGRAGRAVQVVVVVDVAVGAGARRNRVQAGKRESGAVVIKRGIEPGTGAVALVAGLREVRRDVVGIGGSLIVLQVTGRAGRAVQVVVVIDVAVGAGARRNGVQSGEREPGAVVVERCVHPVAGVVTGVASLREVRRHVVGIGGSLEILQVAGHAGVGGQVVVVVDVAVGAGARRHGVQAGEREPGAVVIKRGIKPGAGAVALFAGLREIRRDVIGIGGSLEILQVAGHAGRAVQVVVVVDVAVGAGAWRHGVHARQDKAGSRVIELGIGPLHGVVALLAGRRESLMGHRSGGVVVVGLMATDARCNRDVVVVVDVTIGALARRHHMRTGQRES